MTLTEKQEAVKEVLGSTESIRKFVQEEDLHLEDLRTYNNNLASVIKSLDAEAKESVKSEALALLDKARSILALKNFETAEINSILGIGAPVVVTNANTTPKRGAAKGTKMPKYKFPIGEDAGKIIYSEETALQGKKKDDNVVMKACVLKGYSTLKEWLDADKALPEAEQVIIKVEATVETPAVETPAHG